MGIAAAWAWLEAVGAAAGEGVSLETPVGDPTDEERIKSSRFIKSAGDELESPDFRSWAMPPGATEAEALGTALPVL